MWISFNIIKKIVHQIKASLCCIYTLNAKMKCLRYYERFCKF